MQAWGGIADCKTMDVMFDEAVQNAVSLPMFGKLMATNAAVFGLKHKGRIAPAKMLTVLFSLTAAMFTRKMNLEYRHKKSSPLC